MSFSLMPPHCIASLLADAKFASQKHALFVNGISGPGHPRFVTHIDPSCVNDYPQMQVVVDLHGAMVSVRLPIDERIPIDQMLVLKAITRGWDRRAVHVPRGNEHASICRSFLGGGLKKDQVSSSSRSFPSIELISPHQSRC